MDAAAAAKAAAAEATAAAAAAAAAAQMHTEDLTEEEEEEEFRGDHASEVSCPQDHTCESHDVTLHWSCPGRFARCLAPVIVNHSQLFGPNRDTPSLPGEDGCRSCADTLQPLLDRLLMLCRFPGHNPYAVESHNLCQTTVPKLTFNDLGRPEWCGHMSAGALSLPLSKCIHAHTPFEQLLYKHSFTAAGID